MSFDPTPARRGLDLLLSRCPHLDLVKADADYDPSPLTPTNAWLLVTLGQRSEGMAEVYALHDYAIWKNTGAVHGVGRDGAVSDNPIMEVGK
jgi:hypothetical protein